LRLPRWRAFAGIRIGPVKTGNRARLREAPRARPREAPTNRDEIHVESMRGPGNEAMSRSEGSVSH
jgi:hypothetical protein